jgi:hypothetical protein
MEKRTWIRSYFNGLLDQKEMDFGAPVAAQNFPRHNGDQHCDLISWPSNVLNQRDNLLSRSCDEAQFSFLAGPDEEAIAERKEPHSGDSRDEIDEVKSQARRNPACTIAHDKSKNEADHVRGQVDQNSAAKHPPDISFRDPHRFPK